MFKTAIIQKMTARAALALFVWCASAEDGRDVVVLYNSKSAASKNVADYYAEKRSVPASQVIGLPMSESEEISRAEYREQILEPFVKRLEDEKIIAFKESARTNSAGNEETVLALTESKIRYAVLCYGVPVKIAPDPSINEPEFGSARPEMRRNEAAVDNELALLPLFYAKYPLSGPLGTRLFGVTNAATIHPTNGVLMVTRLDGPTPEIARGLVDKAVLADQIGLWGRAYFDARGLTNTGHKLGDDMLVAAAAVGTRFGFETVVDKNPAVFPAGYPLSDIAIYAGWYEHNVTGALAEPMTEFMPGAFAYHLHSFSGQILRATNQRWVGPLLARGATVTMGCTEEPYLEGTPDIHAFIGRWTFLGFSFGEAAYACQKTLSWQTTVIGDPLYRPFARKAQELHENLQRLNTPLIVWSWLKVANMALAMNTSADQVINLVTKEIPAEHLKMSSVLNEKVGDLFHSQGKVYDAIGWYEKALALEMSAAQRVRVSQTVAPLLAALGEGKKAYEIYKRLLKDVPDHPNRATWREKLLPLAERFGAPEEVEELKKK